MPRFLVSMEHGPQSCAFTDPVRRQRALDAATDLAELARAHGVEVQAAFANVVEHRAYLYVDAAESAAVERLLIESRMYAQNSCRIEPVRPMAEVANLLEELG